MADGIESLGRIRAKGLSLLAVTFAVGLLAGIAAERSLASRRTPDFPFRPPGGAEARTGPGAMRSWGAGGLPRMFEELDLTEEQRTEIAAILERWRPRTEAFMEEMMPRLRATSDSARAEIRAVLTTEQVAQLDSITDNMRARRGFGRRGFPGAREGRGGRGGRGGRRPIDVP